MDATSAEKMLSAVKKYRTSLINSQANSAQPLQNILPRTDFDGNSLVRVTRIVRLTQFIPSDALHDNTENFSAFVMGLTQDECKLFAGLVNHFRGVSGYEDDSAYTDLFEKFPQSEVLGEEIADCLQSHIASLSVNEIHIVDEAQSEMQAAQLPIPLTRNDFDVLFSTTHRDDEIINNEDLPRLRAARGIAHSTDMKIGGNNEFHFALLLDLKVPGNALFRPSSIIACDDMNFVIPPGADKNQGAAISLDSISYGNIGDNEVVFTPRGTNFAESDIRVGPLVYVHLDERQTMQPLDDHFDAIRKVRFS